MPDLTPNFDLPFPSSIDAPCDFAEQWCDFTAAIDTVFDTWESAIGRTLPVIPVAILLQTVTTSIGNFNPLRFDTVLVDTAGMTDIDVDPFTITIPKPGRYTVAAWVEKPSLGAPFVPNETSIFIQPEFDAQGEVTDRGTGVQYHLNAYFSVGTYAAGDKVRLSFSVGLQALFQIDRSWLAAFWHSDTEAP